MKKYILPIVLILGITIILSFVSAQCVDTDGGDNKWEKGKLVFNEQDYAEDFCYTQNQGELYGQVGENFCINNGAGTSTSNPRECPIGCEDGACIKDYCLAITKGHELNLGVLDGKNKVSLDYCKEITSSKKDKINEYVCSNENGIESVLIKWNATVLLNYSLDCRLCSDSDNGKDYYVKGNAILGSQSLTDFCREDGSLIEQFCGIVTNSDGSKEKSIYSETYDCPTKCEEGVCIKFKPSKETGPIDLPEVTVPENNTTNQNVQILPIQNESTDEKEETIKINMCEGCVLNDKCYPLGFRKDGNYCSDKDSKFISQNKPDSSCENNFECDSNLCVNNQCISGSLWQKIMNWFSKLFGGN